MSRSSSSSSSPTSTSTFNLGLQDIDGEAIAAVDSTVTINTSDVGAVAGGLELARRAVDAAERGGELVAYEAGRNLDVVAGALVSGQRDAFDAVSDAYSGAAGAVADASGAAIRASGDALVESLDFGRDIHSTSLDVVDRALDSTLVLAEGYASELRSAYEGVGEYVERVGSGFLETVERFQARESTNTDARLEGVTKNALVVAAVVAGGALLVMALR